MLCSLVPGGVLSECLKSLIRSLNCMKKSHLFRSGKILPPLFVALHSHNISDTIPHYPCYNTILFVLCKNLRWLGDYFFWIIKIEYLALGRPQRFHAHLDRKIFPMHSYISVSGRVMHVLYLLYELFYRYFIFLFKKIKSIFVLFLLICRFLTSHW